VKHLTLLLLALTLIATYHAHGEEIEETRSDIAIQPLSWLEGSWRGDFEGNPFEAHYTSPQGGAILGMSKEFLKDGRCWIEYELFTNSGDTVKVTPYPGGEKSVSFVLTGYDPSIKYAVFENKTHDFPTDITYELIAADSLRILVAGPGKNGRKVLTVNLARQR
jgi:hypothetical protein